MRTGWIIVWMAVAFSPLGAQESPAPQSKASEQAVQPRYQLLRSEEDWSFLKDSTKRSDYLDPIKYIRLRENHDDWFLTLGGEIRPFYENFRNENFGASPLDPNGYVLQRYMFHTNWRLGKGLRFFGELKSGLENGRRGGARPPDEDYLDINQAFVEFELNFDRKQTEIAPDTTIQNPSKPTRLALRLGRQEVDFGSGRLVSVREGPNVRQAFDGAKGTANIDQWRVDVFALKPVDTPRGFFDDSVIPTTTFWGVYAVRPFPLLPKSNVDLYYLGINRKLAKFDQGEGRETRHTIGARFWNNKGQNFDYDVEFAGQFGAFRSGNIQAGFLSLNTGYTFKKNKWQPRIGLAGGINSGDRNLDDPDLQTFSPPFPRGRYFGQIGANGPNNIAGFSPNISLALSKKITVAADSYFFFRESLADGIYGIPGNLLRTGKNNRARFVGWQPQIEATWRLDGHATLSVNYARFFVGNFIEQTPPSSDIRYFSTWLTYKF